MPNNEQVNEVFRFVTLRNPKKVTANQLHLVNYPQAARSSGFYRSLQTVVNDSQLSLSVTLNIKI